MWLSNVVGVTMVTILLVHGLMYRDKIMPRVAVEEIELTGLTKGQALSLLKMRYEEQPPTLKFSFEEKTIDIDSRIEVGHDFEWAVTQAMSVGRNGNALTRLRERIEVVQQRRNLEMPITMDSDAVDGLVAKIGEIINKPAKTAGIRIEKKKIVVDEGWPGVQLEENKLKEKIGEALRKTGETTIDIPADKVSPDITDEQKVRAKAIADYWLGKDMRLKFEDYELKLKDEDIVKYLGVGQKTVNDDLVEGLIKKIKAGVERDPENAVFRFEEGKVSEFKADKKGVKLNEETFKQMFYDFLYQSEKRDLEIPVKLTEAKVKAGDVNNLGLKEVIGVGKSRFAHSIPGRVFNVNLAGSRINGALIPPGETFSFNLIVGDISKETGYQSAYIIKEGRTVLGDGGGVCQVSTTVFRAALNAGLPIVERKAHAYRVSYYEQDSKPGVDATVFNPSADLKFKNDTPAHILVQTFVDTKNLTMKVEIYGTKDGRKITLTEPKIYSQTPAPAPLYTDDPTLPKGQVKQIDWAAAGAKVSFDYKVEKDGETTFEKTFFSNYQPWQAVYLTGTM